MVGSLFSMDAWNNVGFASGELKNPEKDLPFAMAVGVLTVTTLYVLANVAYLNVLPGDAIANAPQERVGTAAMQAMFGPAGLYIMAIAIMISTFGCNNGLILSGARVYYAMAQDNLFFKSAANLHPSVQDARARADRAGDLDLRAVSVGHVWPAAQLRDLRGRRLLRSHRDRAVPAAEKASRSSAPRARTGVSLLPALYVVLTGSIAIDLLIQDATRTYAMLGLALVLLGVPVYFGWRRMAA
jgi:APA family basic amino acid/polyamine antiporter